MNLLSEFKEGLWISWDALRANKMRSILTTLGIVIGIVTVTLMGTAIAGLNRAFADRVSLIGADVLYIHRFSWFINSYTQWMKAQNRREISLVQVKAFEKEMTLAAAIAPTITANSSVKYQNRHSDSVGVIGTSEQFLEARGGSVEQGRFFTANEAAGGRPVCVLGNTVATNLFRLESPIGRKIRVEKQALEVVGVLAKQGSFFGEFSVDDQVLIPAGQFLHTFERYPDFQIIVKAKSLALLDEAKEQARGVLRKVRRVRPTDPDDFSIDQQDMFLKAFARVRAILGSVGLFITGLSLFVGGIGIMNIMFVSVAERTREIGIRKAIGARRRTILLQFLIEAAGICLFAGLLGLAIAYPLTLLLAKRLPATMSLPVAGAALAVSLATGVASGFFPAWRAARMNPVDALRNE